MMLYLLFYSPSTQFVLWHEYTTRFSTTCFGLMGPSSGMISFYVQSPFCYATHPTLASVHTLGVRGMYVLCCFALCQMYCLWEV
jgi:hypothetical protein